MRVCGVGTDIGTVMPAAVTFGMGAGGYLDSQSGAMLLMHRAVWLRPGEGIHATWTQAVDSYRRRLQQPLAS